MAVRLDRRFRPRLSVAKILAWADAHHKRTGKWPTVYSGEVTDARPERETWRNINDSLTRGLRGMPGQESLASMLEQHRNKRNHLNLARLTVKQILAWADDHHRRTGGWPTHNSGAVSGSDGEKWMNINTALRDGQRGLPGGTSLAKLLELKRGVRYPQLVRLTEKQILAWAREHRRRTGDWPHVRSGKVHACLSENWANIDQDLARGFRGLPGGSSLARFLA